MMDGVSAGVNLCVHAQTRLCWKWSLYMEMQCETVVKHIAVHVDHNRRRPSMEL